jgi:hypothetical protein
MHDRVARAEWHECLARCVKFTGAFQRHDPGVVVWRTMREHRAAMAAGNVAHAAVFNRGFLQRHPDADLTVGDAGIVPVRLVLMPRCGRTVACGLADRVLKPRFGIRTEKLPCDGECIHPKIRIEQFRREFRRIQQLREPRRSPVVVFRADHVEVEPAFVTGLLREESVVNAAHALDFRRRSKPVNREETFLLKTGNLFGRQFERRGHESDS